MIEQSKWSIFMLKQGYILTLMSKVMIKIPSFKEMIMQEYQNIKTLLQNIIYQLVWRSFWY